MSKDYFEHKAHSYEQNKSRVDNVENIANAIHSAVRFNKTMHIMDFGSGTGLLLERVALYVDKITAVDISKSMNSQLAEKRSRLDCVIEIVEIDLEKSRMTQQFDGIISSMTMHHIADVKTMSKKFHSMLKDGGFIAIADLDSENGSFHTEDTGVFHLGFDRNEMLEIALDAGFRNIDICSASVVYKPQGDFPIFLLTGFR